MNSAGAVLRMMAIDAQPPDRVLRRTDKDNEPSKQVEMSVSGCSSILSVPLPNSGDYSGVHST